MKLGDILRQSGRAQPVEPHPVEFTAKGQGSNFEIVTARVKAVMICLDEDQRTAARVSALAEVEKRFKDKAVPRGIVDDEETYHMLCEALRQPEQEGGIYPKLCSTVLELRTALVFPEAKRLWSEYNTYLAREFPEAPDDETWKQLLEDAKKNSLSDLLTSYGYGRVSQALSSLAGLSSP